MKPQQNFSQAFIEKLEDDCLRHLECFFRDAMMSSRVFMKYKSRQILKEEGFMDVSELEGGMAAHVRYHIFSGICENYKESFSEFSAWTLPRNCFFKVLDVTDKQDFGLITLLQIPEYAISYFALNTHPIEAKLVADAHARFDIAIETPPIAVRKDPYWLKRTRFPIGIQWDNSFFFEFDYSDFPKLDPSYKRKNIFQRIFR